MNVWIVNPFDNLPLEGFRPMRYWLMAEAFVAAGCKVVYWTGDFSHANKRKRVLADKRFSCGFEIVQLPVMPYYGNVSLRRVLSHTLLARTFLQAARSSVGNGGYDRPDLIVASSPPLGLVSAVHKLATQFKAKVIVDVMDAWPETFERIVPRVFLRPLREVAKQNYFKASAVTTVADSYSDLVRGYGYDGTVKKFFHGIALGGDFPSLVPRSGAKQVRLVYAGNLGLSYDLMTVLRALCRYGASVHLDIAGKGEGEQALKDFVETEKLGNVSFHGYLPEGKLSELLLSSDVGIVPMDPASCVAVPYKFADYAKYSLAIVSSLGGESASLLHRYGAGAAYRHGDVDSLIEAFDKVIGNITSMKAASRKMAEREFDASVIYREYAGFAMQIGGKTCRGA